MPEDYEAQLAFTDGRPTYAGIKMQQHREVFVPFTHLLHELKPTVIIEFGTGWGGFAMFLSDIKGENTKFVTYDNGNRTHPKARLMDFRDADIFGIQTELEIADLIKSGAPCLLLCDGGNKVREFNAFGPLLKPGDVIMAHDYCPSKEQHAKDGKFHWAWLEIWDEPIQQTITEHGLVTHHADWFTPVAWACFKKGQ